MELLSYDELNTIMITIQHLTSLDQPQTISQQKCVLHLPAIKPNLKTARSILCQLLLLGQKMQEVTWITQPKASRKSPPCGTGLSEQTTPCHRQFLSSLQGWPISSALQQSNQEVPKEQILWDCSSGQESSYYLAAWGNQNPT